MNPAGLKTAEEGVVAHAEATWGEAGRTSAGALLVVLPDGVGIRNFLHGPFIHQASEAGQVRILYTIPEHILEAYHLSMGDQVKWDALIPYRDRAFPLMLRKSLSYAQMYWADTRSMRFKLKQQRGETWRGKAGNAAARLIGQAAASARGIKLLDSWHCAAVSRLPEVEHYRRLFAEVKPSLLFCSHQRPLTVLPPVLAAKEMGVPTATFIFSWDNLTSKDRIAAPFDHYLVWSDHMRQELLRYYPDINSEQIHVVGTPQFDSYADPKLARPREEFFRRIGGDPARPLICYSGSDVTTCPEDPEYVRLLMRLIRSGRVRKQPQVILRPSPVDEGSRYNEVRREFPELIYALPAWVHIEPHQWSSVVPLPEDVEFLANLIRHSDLNVNLASTMTIDYALHDKPVVNIAFDVSEPPPSGVPLWDYYYQFEHYRPVVEIGAARFARSAEDLADHINTYLENPTLDRANRRRLVELEVGVPLGQSSRRIFEVLKSIAH